MLPSKEPPKKILLVEDEEPLLNLVKQSLETEGFEVGVAKSASEAKNYLERHGVADLIWLDHRLIGSKNGIDFTKEIKNSVNIGWNKIPIFVVATIITEQEVKDYLALGVENYYLKSEHRLSKIIEDVKNYLK